MQLSISGKQVGVDGALRGHIERQLTAAMSKYFDRPIEAQVQFSREAHLIRADISVHPASGILLQSHAESDDIRTAFDLAIDRVAKRLRRFKRRLVSHQTSKPGPEAQEMMARQAVPGADTDHDAGEEAPGDGPVTIAETAPRIDRYTVREAVLHLESDDLSVLLFRNRGHGGLNVVYRRRDGNIGWIDPGALDAAE